MSSALLRRRQPLTHDGASENGVMAMSASGRQEGGLAEAGSRTWNKEA
jgi:hypothetical protein